MKRKRKASFWEAVARLILRNRIALIFALVGVTAFWATQWQYMRFTFTEANLLPDNHPENIKYNDFLSLYGEEGSVLVLAVKDASFFTPKKLNAWKELSEELAAFDEIDFVLSIDNVKELVKNKAKKKFELQPLMAEVPQDSTAFALFKQKLFLELPFYENLLFNKETETVRMAIYMEQEVVNSARRKAFVFDTFIPLIDRFEAANNLKVRRSGMPYIRTLNAQNIVDEIGMFVFAAMGVTSLIFFCSFVQYALHSYQCWWCCLALLGR